MVSLKDYRCGASAAVSNMERAREFYERVLGLVPGTDTRDNNKETVQHLTFVDDVVEGMLLAAGSAAAVGQTYILAGPRYTDLNELVRATARVLGVGVPRGRIPLGLGVTNGSCTLLWRTEAPSRC